MLYPYQEQIIKEKTEKYHKSYDFVLSLITSKKEILEYKKKTGRLTHKEAGALEVLEKIYKQATVNTNNLF